MKILRDLFERQFKHIYNSELLILDGLAAMSDFASDNKLKKFIRDYRNETGRQLKRLEEIALLLHFEYRIMDGKVIIGLLEETNELFENFSKGFLVDVAILGKLRQIEHFQISEYEIALLYANTLKIPEVADKINETLMESYEADECCSAFAEEFILNRDSNDDSFDCE